MGKQQRLKEQRKLEKIQQEAADKNKSKKLFSTILLLAVVVGGGYFSYKLGTDWSKKSALSKVPETENKKDGLEDETMVTLETNKGVIKAKLFKNKSPKTVENFLKLSQENFYNGVKFHRVIKDFMIQTGDPNSKDNDWNDDGTGGPGYQFEDEINDVKLVKGKIAMANSGPNTNGSQFFIVTAESTPWLDGKHTVFGEVIEGMDVVTAIEGEKTNENDHPTEDVVINKISKN